MLRALWFVSLLGVLAAASMWLADNPGRVSIDWQGYLIETSAAVLVAVLALLAFLSALTYRLWILLRGVPAGVARHRRDSRRRRGYLALSRGMVAVAAGDSEEAGRQAGRADGLLEEPSLTMLLSAQSAQLNGDEKAAEKFFRDMLNSPDMEFLGLRGLLTQSMKNNDTDESLKWARRAFRLKPESDWVASTLFDLTVHQALWAEADEALAGALRRKQVSAAEAARSRAVLNHQMSLAAEADGDKSRALKLARKACADAPDLVPAQVRLAGLLAASGKDRKAVQGLETAWGALPHPDLAEAYWPVGGDADAMARMKAAQQLAAAQPKHPASLLMLARAALDARLWGEARQHMKDIAASGEPVSRACCQLMAELEEAEHNDMAAAREWLVRAANAEPDPAWVCEDCGNAADTWTALCGGCGGFNTFHWRTPVRVPGLSAPAGEEPKRVAGDGVGEEPAKLPARTPSQDIDVESAAQ